MTPEILKEVLGNMDLKGLDFSALSSLPDPNAEKRKEWLRERFGVFSASDAVRLMGFEDKKELPKGALTYITEKVIDVVTEKEPDEGFKSNSMERGNNEELAAALAISEKLNRIIYYVSGDQKFIKKMPHFGCTPDGLIFVDDIQDTIIETGIETKCPDSKTHMFYTEKIHDAASLKEHMNDYYWQIQTTMWATNTDHWYFGSFDSRFKNPEKRLHLVRIERVDADINKFRNRLMKAIELKENKIAAWK